MAQPFHERSIGSQLAVLATMMAAMGIPAGGIGLWAADAYIDQTYASDQDLKAVQENLNARVDQIAEVVGENTETVQATTKSVDSLTLVVLDIQIERLQGDIAELESEKRAQGAGWVESEERALRNAQQRLSDFKAQRDLLFARIITPT